MAAAAWPAHRILKWSQHRFWALSLCTNNRSSFRHNRRGSLASRAQHTALIACPAMLQVSTVAADLLSMLAGSTLSLVGPFLQKLAAVQQTLRVTQAAKKATAMQH